ncbi:TetR/AcrR family transcriptional regulator [Actinomadura sp. NEAU-AAG7]|uniref:TetR/AcrR family transcriptional regulator n=1 Tax=Actinomadura sp. NEAU-AAG7 TaxID=2839640 RepID=UPI001BE3E93B|nr:TetR/AcrR family transcriptional regulator [Actinomadura sp. NEAU-AAG7]MBT2206609.1 TetR/AcrR family transcriptional regulator [Actinomadura sp. NEAU-AAG7]
MAKSATSPRERYRAQVREEIKERAWEQIATAGASALSLNAIAKQMGMSGPALYRYFAGRDELITELIKDAYRSQADTLKAAVADDPDLATLAHALRRWALDDPQRYFLLHGTPIPGYHAPDETTAIADEVMRLVLDACQEIPAADPPTDFEEHLATSRHWAKDHPAPPQALHRALSTWTRVQGVLSLELAGHFAPMGFDPARLFEAEVESLTTP